MGSHPRIVYPLLTLASLMCTSAPYAAHTVCSLLTIRDARTVFDGKSSQFHAAAGRPWPQTEPLRSLSLLPEAFGGGGGGEGGKPRKMSQSNMAVKAEKAVEMLGLLAADVGTVAGWRWMPMYVPRQRECNVMHIV